MTQLYDQLPENSIRLLELQYEANKDDPLTGKLFTAKLDGEIKYNALSYVWGDTQNQPKNNIVVDGVTIDISNNLSRALRQIRALNCSHPFWIDQISINSEDIEEKSNQVRHMGRVYSVAEEVFAIICDRDCDCNVLSEAVNCSPTRSWARHIEELHHLPLSTHVFETNFQIEDMADAFAGNLPFNCEWWHRMWTAQEMFFAKKLTFMSRGYSISGDALEHFCHWYVQHMTSCCLLTNQLPGINVETRVVVLHAANMFVARKRSLELGWTTSLIGGLMHTRHRKATNPLDKVYALAGFTKLPPDLIDYRLSPRDCYTKITQYFISSRRELSILGHANDFKGKNGSMISTLGSDHCAGEPIKSSFGSNAEGVNDLPSWVSDWSITGNASESMAALVKHRFHSRYYAGGDEEMCAEFTSDRHLILRGIKCASIIKTSTTFAEFEPLGEVAAAICAALIGLKIIDEDLGDPPGSRIRDRCDDLLHRLCRDNPRAEPSYQVLHIMLAARDPTEVVSAILLDLNGEDLGAKLVTFHKFQTYLKKATHFLRVMNRHLILTSDDALGFASTESKPGDFVCVLYGSNVPFILRPILAPQEPSLSSGVSDEISTIDEGVKRDDNHTRSQYQIIGNAYVQGLMGAEAVQGVKEGIFTEEDFCLT